MSVDSVSSATSAPSPREQLHIAPVTPAAPAAVPAAQEITMEQMKKAMEAVNRALESVGGSVQFTVDKETGKTVVRVIDTATHELIRQIPSEEMLQIARSLDRLQGLLIHQRA
ncbi:MAG: flagellar protein FlaG [Burkholderiales bacterium]